MELRVFLSKVKELLLGIRISQLIETSVVSKVRALATKGKNLQSKVIDSLANLAIFADMLIREFGKRSLNVLPNALQEALVRLNENYKSHRNQLLGIDVYCPKPVLDSPKSHHSVKCDLNAERALQRGDVPGWVLVVLMTTGLVTALWTIAAPRLSQILKNSLDSMNSIR
jgi:hypothetical protein